MANHEARFELEDAEANHEARSELEDAVATNLAPLVQQTGIQKQQVLL